MRILMLAHRLPFPPHTGDKVRAYHVARHLARTHALTLACLADEPGVEPSLAALSEEVGEIVCARIARGPSRLWALWSLACGGSATISYFRSPELRGRVAAELRQGAVDLVYVSSSSMAQYLPHVNGTPVLMDFVDVDSDKWRQYGARLSFPKSWVYRLESTRLRDHELAAARRANRCLLATPREEALLHSFAPWVPTSVVPNGVDLEYFAPAAVPAEEPAIIFTGAMDSFPNVDAVTFFAEDVFPRIRREVKGARFLIVGKDPVPAVRRLGGLPDVEVTGSVPDVRPFVRRAAVSVAPLRVARGVQNKVLEAMAMGLPVVATSRAHEGLDARPGEHLFVEDDPGSFGTTVVRLLRTPALRATLGRAARAFVERHHSWSASMAKLDQIVEQVTRRRPAAAVEAAR